MWFRKKVPQPLRLDIRSDHISGLSQSGKEDWRRDLCVSHLFMSGPIALVDCMNSVHAIDIKTGKDIWSRDCVVLKFDVSGTTAILESPSGTEQINVFSGETINYIPRE